MKSTTLLAMVGAAAVLCFGAGEIVAQNNPGGGQDGQRGGRQGRGGGNFDPAQRMERLKEDLEIKDDTEWKAIEPLIQKVTDAQRVVFSDRMRGMFGRGPRPSGDNPTGGNDQGERRNFRGGFGGEPSPEAEALQKAIDGKAPNAELKAALAKFLETRKAHQAALEKAQADLRKVLTPRQEAIATLRNGLL